MKVVALISLSKFGNGNLLNLIFVLGGKEHSHCISTEKSTKNTSNYYVQHTYCGFASKPHNSIVLNV